MSGAALSPLQPGDKVAVIAPANYFAEERLEPGLDDIRSAGFVPFVHVQCIARQGRFAGCDDVRRAALEDCYRDPSIKAILCARGGYGSQRYVDQLDFNLIAANPKPLVGYSDVTVLLNAIAQKTGQVTFHGPMLGDFTRTTPNPKNAENWAYLWRLLRGEAVQPADHSASSAASPLSDGVGEGVLLGGNLSLLATDCGTPTQIKANGAILLLEDVSEDLYQFDRMLWQLKRAGLFAALRGVVIGDLVDVGDKGEPAFGQSVDDVVASHFGALGIPVATNYPAGHGDGRITLPIGAKVRLDVKAGQVRLTHGSVF